jgi:alanine racemase
MDSRPAGISWEEVDRGAILEIDLGAIVANWRALVARHPSGPVAGVVKADAYGLGALRVAPALHRAGCRHFFVAHLTEALSIRDLIPPTGPDATMVAVLNGMLPGTEALHVQLDIVPVLGTLEEIDRWTAEARREGRRLPAILHVDTGMHRLGLDARQVIELANDPGRLAGLDLLYVMTHLVSAELPDDPVNELQRHRFELACKGLPAAPRSLANSSGLFLGPGFASDLARPGAALYGINPTPHLPNPMRCTVRLRARVLQLRDIPAGETVGYNATWRASRPSRIATACVGYADGWPRTLSGHGHALFDGAPVPLVGRVSMDLTTYDATDHPTLAEGDWLELIGPDLPPDAIAAEAGTNGYEILTSLGGRYARHYTGAADA